MKRALLIAVAVLAVLAVELRRRALAQQRHASSAAQVAELLRAQARGDAAAMLRRSSTAPTRACVALVRANARTPARPRRAEDRALPVADRARAALAHEADARRVVHARAA